MGKNLSSGVAFFFLGNVLAMMEFPFSDDTSFTRYLALIAEMSRSFVASHDLAAVAQHGLDRIADYMAVEAASLFLFEQSENELVCYACHGPVDVSGLRLPAHQGVVGRAVQTGTAQMVIDTAKDDDFHATVDKRTGFTTRSILTVPLNVGQERLGAIQVINKKDRQHLFCKADLHVLEVLAAAVGLAILNVRHAKIEQERVRHELELAAEI